MAKPIFNYTIHRVGYKRMLQRGRLRARSLEQAIKKMQRKIRKTVLKKKIPLVLRVWNAEDKTERFKKQYNIRKDFRSFRKPPKWRQALSRQVKYSRTYDPTPRLWFVAVGRKRRGHAELVLTQLAYDPAKKTLLRRKRKRLIGPFETEEAARQFKEGVEQKIEAAREDKMIVERRGEQ